MTSKSKRKLQLEQARGAKLAKSSDSKQTMNEPAVSEPLASPQPSTSSASFSEPTDSALSELGLEIAEEFDEQSSRANYASKWVESLNKDDLLSLSVL